MNRSTSTPAIILRNTRIGEIHKGVTLLTPDEGLVSAIAHGAYSQKGKLRGTTNLFCAGTAYLYTDPVRKSTKITDMDASDHFPAIREDLTRFYTASLWAESILKTYATGGEASRLFLLLHQALGELDRRPPADSERVSIQFVWRLLGLSGFQPDLYSCACSGEELGETEPVFYAAAHDGFCSERHATEEMPRWQPGAVAYMRHTSSLEFRESLRVHPPPESGPRLKRVLYEILQTHVETPLNTLRTGAGIL